jgi:hypothetical protein
VELFKKKFFWSGAEKGGIEPCQIGPKDWIFYSSMSFCSFISLGGTVKVVHDNW